MAENMLSSDGSLQSGDALSLITQITSIADAEKGPIQAQSLSLQSTARNKTIQSFTIPEEEEVEIPLRNVKARILEEEEGSCKEQAIDMKEKRGVGMDLKEEIIRCIDQLILNSVSQRQKDMLVTVKAMIVKAIEMPDHI